MYSLLPLCIYIMFLKNNLLFLSIPLFLYLVLNLNGWWYQHVLALHAVLTRAVLKGLNLPTNLFKIWICVCIFEILCMDWLRGFNLRKCLHIYMGRVWKCVFALAEFGHPGVTLFGWQDFKLPTTTTVSHFSFASRKRQHYRVQ